MTADEQPMGCSQRIGENLEPWKPGTYTLRVSFLEPASTSANSLTVGRYRLICDALVAPGAPVAKTEIRAPTGVDASNLVIRVEAFRQEAEGDTTRYLLAYTGQQQPRSSGSPHPPILLHKAGGQSCWQGLRAARAFHTATVLPNGQVLLVGGVSGNPSALQGDHPEDAVKLKDGAFVETAVDIFDPVTMTEVRASSTEPLPGRAFHEAYLLPSPVAGPYAILLVGGLTPSEAGQPVAFLRQTDPSQPFQLSPSPQARAASLAVLVYGPATGSTPPRVTYTEAPSDAAQPGLFPATVLDSEGRRLLVVPGATSYTASGADQGFTAQPQPLATWIDLGTDDNARVVVGNSVSMTRLRAGHTVARLDQSTFVVLGGNMDGPDETVVAEMAETAAADQGFAVASIDGATTASAWHSLTALGLTDQDRLAGAAPTALLWGGGFALSTGDTSSYRYAVEPQPEALQVIWRDGVTLKAASVSESDVAGGFEAAAYHRATRLPDGSVLLSGGNSPRPRSASDDQTATCSYHTCSAQPTEGELQTSLCPLDQLAIYERDAPDAPARLHRREEVPNLRCARYGHRVTRLVDNTLLFTGGLALGADGTTESLSQAEIYNPNRGLPTDDNFADPVQGREPGQLANPCGP